MKVTTLDGLNAVLDEAKVAEFKAALRGPLIQPGDDVYDEARKLYNAMIDRRPSLIIGCAGVSDVINSVNFARTNNLLLAVRGAGHNVAGLAVCDGGIGNCSELRGSEQPAAFQEGIETSGPPGAKEGCQGHLAVGALP